MNSQALIETLKLWKLRTTTEKLMQSDIESVLHDSDVSFDREFRLTDRDVIDFKVDRTGIECKIKGSKAQVLRQLIRYASFEALDEILLVTTRSSHREFDGEVVQGKSIRVFWVNGL